MKLSTKKRLKYGSLSTAVTIVFIVIVVVINAISVYLVDRYPLKLDLTSNQAFDLTDESMTIVNALEEDITIYVLADKKDFAGGEVIYSQVAELIEMYGKRSDHIKVVYKDPTSNPSFKNNYPNETVQQYDVIVQGKDRYKYLSFDKLVSYDENYNPVASSAETYVSSALLSVTSKDIPKVVFLQGHGEQVASDFESLLEMNNFDVERKDLATISSFDAQTRFVVICAPSSDFTKDELKKLDAFLNNGGENGKHIIAFLTSGQPEMPQFTAFLKEWGIVAGEGMVYETDTNNTIGSNFYPVVSYTNTEIAKALLTNSTSTVMPLGLPLSVTTQNSRVEVETLLSYSDTAAVTTKEITNSWTPDKSEIKENMPAAIRGTNTAVVGENNEKVNSSVTAFSAVNMLAGSFLSESRYGNGDYMINLFNNYIDRGEQVVIEAKQIGNVTSLALTDAQANVIGYIFMLALPVITLVIGIAVFLRRRHL